LIGVAVWGAEFVEHPEEVVEARAIVVGEGACGFEEEVVGPVGGELEVEVGEGRGGGEGVGVIGVGGGAEGVGCGGGGGGGYVVVRVVVSGRRRGQVFFIHVKVEAFFVFLVGVMVVVLSGGSGTARGSAGGGVEGWIGLWLMVLLLLLKAY